ncbi:MAG: hypothetical protein P4L51_08455 [Puia sp.]|nr:hypothetical protein [Puia sp.]
MKICTGKTVIPGMVMLHEHLYYTMEMGDFFNVAEMPYSFPRMYLAGGATTIRTGGSIEPQTDLAINRMIQAGMLIGPDMDVTAMVNFWADRGCTSFKMYTHATREDMIAVAREAHKRHLKVTGHIATLKLTPIQFLVISHTASSFHIPTPSAVTNT